jgi:peptide/nickel transport system substrate-binding protein
VEERGYWQRALGGRTSRRAVLRGSALGAAGLAGAALIGCGSSSKSTPTPAAATKAAGAATAAATAAATQAAQPKTGGNYRTGFTGPFAGVDPHNSVYGGSGIVPQVYSYLIRKEVMRPDAGTINELSSSHALQSDNVTWVFKLRADAKIAPNAHSVPERPMDSEDVVKSWDRVADAKVGSNGYIFFSRWVDKYDAPDAQTVRIILKKPYAWVEEQVGDNLQGAIVPKEWLASADIKKDAVGSGPFMLKELTEGQRAVMVRNPNYYETGKPYLDQTTILAFQDQATYRTAFSSGQLDGYGALDIEEAKQLEQSVKNVVRYEDTSTGYDSFWMRVDQPPWNDGRVRRAMNMAMDRSQYISLIGKGQGTAMGPVAPVFGDYALPAAELAKLQPYDPTQAKQLFSAAGVSEVAFNHPTSSNMNDYVNILVQQLQKVGVTAKPGPQDAGTWVAAYFSSKLAASFSLNQSYKTPDFALQWYHTGGITGNGHYDTGFSVPEVDAAIDKAAGTLPEADRKAAYLDAQRTVFKNDPPFLNVFNVAGNPLVYKTVQNYVHGPGTSINYYSVRNIWLNA